MFYDEGGPQNLYCRKGGTASTQGQILHAMKVTIPLTSIKPAEDT